VLTPDEYARKKPRTAARGFYYSFLFLPPSAARDHRALRFLPGGSTTRWRTERSFVARETLTWWRGRGRAALAGDPRHPGDARRSAPVIAPFGSCGRGWKRIMDGMEMT